MTRRSVGLSICAVAVAAFFVALFGHFREHSPLVAAISAGALIVGLVVTALSLRSERLRAPHPAVIATFVVALALHFYENVSLRSGDFSIGFLLWPLTPYVLCLAISCIRGTHLASIAGAVAALCFDLFAHYTVFVRPTSSTAGLALLFAPLWNTLVFSPIATFIAWLVLRKRAATGRTAP